MTFEQRRERECTPHVVSWGMSFPGKGRRAEALKGPSLAGSGIREEWSDRVQKEGQVLESPGSGDQGLGFHSE